MGLLKKSVGYLNLAVVSMILVMENIGFAQSGAKFDFVTKLTTDPAKPIITAILAIFTLITILEKWTDIMSGQNLAKNLFIIAGWIAMTTWWSELLGLFIK